MKTTYYKDKDGNISTIKNRYPGISFSFSPDGVMKGSSTKVGNLTTFSDAAFKPKKYGIKLGSKTTYYSPSWSIYK